MLKCAQGSVWLEAHLHPHMPLSPAHLSLCVGGWEGGQFGLQTELQLAGEGCGGA